MNKSIFAGLLIVVVPFITYAQTGTVGTEKAVGVITVKNPGLLPGDFFYFLDKLGETINLAFTFNKEKKARKHIEYAEERIAEMKEVLKSENSRLEDIKDVKDDFDLRIKIATDIVKSEKDGGKDVSGLARELDEELESSKDDLREILKGHKDRSSNAEERLIMQIASLSQGDPQLPGLTRALEMVSKEKDDSVKEEDDIDDDFASIEDALEEIMGKQISSKKHAEEVAQMATSLAGQVPDQAISSSRALLKKASDANARGDFESARKYSKEAKEILKDAVELKEENEDEANDLMEDGLVPDDTLRDLEDRILREQGTTNDRVR